MTIRVLLGIAHDLAESGRDAEKVDALLESARVLWDLRVLDAWHNEHGMRIPAPQVWNKTEPGQEFMAEVPRLLDAPRRENRVYGKDPDAVRAAAAAAVWHELLIVTRVVIGARP